MGLDRDRALGAVRLSLGRWTTTADVDRAADLFATAAHRRRTQPAGTTDTR
jgi:cysteine desulfurase